MPTGILPYSSGSIGRIGGIRRPDIAPLYDHFGTGTDWVAMEATVTARSSNSSAVCIVAAQNGISSASADFPPPLVARRNEGLALLSKLLHVHDKGVNQQVARLLCLIPSV